MGIILYSEDREIEWANPYLNDFIDKDQSIIGQSLSHVSETLLSMANSEMDEEWVAIHDRKFHLIHKRDHRLIYLFDRTEQIEIEKKHQDEETVLAIIYLDNYDELTQAMDDTLKSQLNSQVTSLLNNWSKNHGIFLKRTSSDRFLAVMNQEILSQLEKTKFEILDEVRELISDQNVSLTLSIGVGKNTESLPELGTLAIIEFRPCSRARR